MGEILVFQLNVADAVSIRHLHAIGIRLSVLLTRYRVGHDLRAGCRFRAVSGFRRNGLCDDILQIEVFLDHRINGFQSPFLPVKVRGNDGDEHIGVMPDFRGLDMVLVIAGMILLIALHLVLKLSLFCRVSTLGGKHVVILGRIGADHDGFQHELDERRTGLQAAHDNQKHGTEQNDHQRRRVLSKIVGYLFCRSLRAVSGLLRCLCGVFRPAHGRPSGLCRHVFSANRPLLLPA